MAYVMGIITKRELEELERRGWEVEPAPEELVPDELQDGNEFWMVWVDTDLFDIMNGPDWDSHDPDWKKDK